MQLIVDIGNSNIVIALFKNDAWTNVFRYETKENQPQLYYERGLAEILFEWGVRNTDINHSIISSVVPDINDKIVNAIKNVVGLNPIILGPDLYKSMEMHIPHFNEIGADLVANSFAAIQLYKKPSIIVDFGTALTFTIVHPEKGIQGVSIAPGVKTAFAALADNTAQLPNAILERPDSAIGKNTNHAIQAGIIIGYEGLVKHMIEKIKEELDEAYIIIGTGGLSENLTHITKDFDFVNKMLTLEGIRLIGLQYS